MMECKFAPTTNLLSIDKHEEDTPPLVLDLCVKKRPVSPSYTLSYPSPKSSPVYTETPASLYYMSPKSTSGCSESSEASNQSDGCKEITTSPTSRVKPTRPFKAFPKSPLSLTLDIATKTDPLLLGADFAVAYDEFRQKMLTQVRTSQNTINKNMRRMQNQNGKSADPTYLEKRRKNNEAAKRSRDARKAKEDELAIRCAFLEQEYMKMKIKTAAMESELQRLQRLLYH